MRNRAVKVVGTDVAAEVPAEDKYEQAQNYGLGIVWKFAKGTVFGAATRAWCTVSGFGALGEGYVTVLNGIGNYTATLLEPWVEKGLVNKNISPVEDDVLLLDRKVATADFKGNTIPQSYYVANTAAVVCAAGAALILWGTGGSDKINQHMVDVVGEQAAPYLADMVKQAVGTGAAYAGKAATQLLGETSAVTGLLGKVGLYRRANPSLDASLLNNQATSAANSGHYVSVPGTETGPATVNDLVSALHGSDASFVPAGPRMGSSNV